MLNQLRASCRRNDTIFHEARDLNQSGDIQLSHLTEGEFDSTDSNEIAASNDCSTNNLNRGTQSPPFLIVAIKLMHNNCRQRIAGKDLLAIQPL